MLEFLRQQLAAALDKRKAAQSELEAIPAGALAEKRDLTTGERTAFDEKRAAVKKIDEEIADLQARITDAEDDEKRAAAAAAAHAAAGATGERRSGGATVINEPHVYGKHTRSSYFLDLVRSDMNRGDGDGGVQAARERLARHAKELSVDLPAREKQREESAQRELRTLNGVNDRARENAFEKRVNPNRTDGQGGYFVPPLWLVDEYVALPRFGRVIANAVRNLTLPSGTDSINLPTVATGTAVAAQTADAAAVSSTDLTDSTVSAAVKTLAGQQDIAMQLLDQSPISFDEIVFSDLMADYNVKLDVQVINGSGSSGQAQGILGTSGINAITYTDASPTLPELWPSWVQSASAIESNRKLPATATFCTPAIWYWALSQLDSGNRPFIMPTQQTAYNPLALSQGDGGEGPAGNLSSGLYVFKDGNIPSNLGGGTNETRIITMRTSDLYLWEGSMRTRTLTEVLSGTLQVRVQIYNYFAFMANRLPKAITVISGTGLIPASGF